MTSVAVAPKLRLDGTHRTVEPAATLERLQPVLPAIGVTRVGVITGLDVIGIPVVMICRPNGRSLSVSQGKGVDLPAAKASGIMEAAESWHAENVLLPLRLATYRELRAVARVVDVELLPRQSQSRFHPDLSILWIEGTDVLTAERIWVPYECVHLDFRSPGPQGSRCFLVTGTGLAAGNHQLEAVSHALCEVVERDALALWDERGAGRPGIAPGRAGHGRRSRLRATARHVRAGRGRGLRLGPHHRRGAPPSSRRRSSTATPVSPADCPPRWESAAIRTGRWLCRVRSRRPRRAGSR